jgi:hypothetical protein
VSPFEIDFFSEAFLDNKRLHRPFLNYTPFGYTSFPHAATHLKYLFVLYGLIISISSLWHAQGRIGQPEIT